MEETMYYTATDVRKMLGVSRGKAYQLIKELNEELAQRGGTSCLQGKSLRNFLQKKCMGWQEVTDSGAVLKIFQGGFLERRVKLACKTE